LSEAKQSNEENGRKQYGHYTWTISTSTQNASIRSLTAAAPSDNVFHAPCTNSLTYLLTANSNIVN